MHPLAVAPPSPPLAAAADRARAWLLAHVHAGGVVAHLSTGPGHGFPVIDGGPDHPLRAQVERRLGFPMGREWFSDPSFVAVVGGTDDPALGARCAALLRRFRSATVGGRHHFFHPDRFACDVDVTAVAARARIAAGDVGPGRPGPALRLLTSAILESAAVRGATAAENRPPGRDDGPLRPLVFKVYWDDHRLQDARLDRGRKQDAVVVANATFPVLHEVRAGERSLSEPVALREFVVGDPRPRTRLTTVAAVVAANLAFLDDTFEDGSWREGTRYYPSPDWLLLVVADLVSAFPDVFAPLGTRQRLAAAVAERRAAAPAPPGRDPGSPLALAARGLAAARLGLDPAPELAALVAAQDPDGGWSAFDPLYTFGRRAAGEPTPAFHAPALTTAVAWRALRAGLDRPSARQATDPRRASTASEPG